MANIRAIGFLILVSTAPAVAGESIWLALGHQNPECTCRFKGDSVALGTKICLTTGNGSRLAECIMEQNVTSWKPGSEPCPVAQSRDFSPRRAG